MDSYRNTTPKYEEVKQVYAPIYFERREERLRERLRVGDGTSGMGEQSSGMSGERKENTHDEMSVGNIVVKKHDPHFDLNTITVKEEKRNGYLYVTASLKEATSWAPKGHVIARTQFVDATAPKAKLPKVKENRGKRKDSSLFTLHSSLIPEGQLPPLPCLGITLKLPKELKNLEYLGRGPWDNYPDRHAAALVDIYKSTVAEQYFHYPRPQDSGNHDDVQWLYILHSLSPPFPIACSNSTMPLTTTN